LFVYMAEVFFYWAISYNSQQHLISAFSVIFLQDKDS
jgi:hypothetical protein